MSVQRDTVERRKAMPLATGVLDYFPDALLVVAEVSRIGNEQHHPGEPLHWDKSKSTDEADALLRHLIDRGTLDTDGVRHTAKVAWRALALLQRELDAEAARPGISGNPEWAALMDAESDIPLVAVPDHHGEQGVRTRIVMGDGEDACYECGQWPEHNLGCSMWTT